MATHSGRRSLVGYSPWGHAEMDTTERLHFLFSLPCIGEGNGNPLQYSCLGNPVDTSLKGYSSWGHKRVRHNLTNKQHDHEDGLLCFSFKKFVVLSFTFRNLSYLELIFV